MRVLERVGRLGLFQSGDNCVGRTAVPTASVGDQQKRSLGQGVSRSGSGRHPSRASPAGIARSSARWTKPSQQRSSRRIVEAKNVAELDIRVSVMAVVVLGKHDSEGAQDRSQRAGRAPAEIAWCVATRRGADRAPSPRMRRATRGGRGPPRRSGTARHLESRRARPPDWSTVRRDRSRTVADRGGCASAA